MREGLRKAWVLFTVSYSEMLEYRAEIVLWALSTCLPLILMGVWTQAGASGRFTFNSEEMARYFLAVFLVRQMTVVWVIWLFEEQVTTGNLSFRLLQPLDPVWHHVISHLAERVARLPVIVLLVAGFLWLYPEAFWIPSWRDVLGFLVGCTGALALRFVMQYTFALMAFWSERATSIDNVWFLFYFFLSGLVAPLEAFPPLVREIALWTPFPYTIALPAQLLMGRPVDVGQAALVMGAWGAFFFVLNRWMWRRGLRQYSGMGA